MKIKPLYIYTILIIIALIVLVFMTQTGDNSDTAVMENVPQDSIHQQFRNQSPGKGNVSDEFYQTMETLRRKVEADPDDTTALKEYADYLTAAHQFDGAIPVYQEILKKNDKRTDVYYALTFIYFNKRDYDKAENMTNKILSYDKNNLQAKFNTGAIAYARGNNDKAKDVWNNLIDANPGTREADLAKDALEELDK